ncbi:MAG: hypothetical protein QOJ26_689 [Thermoplasmata archaeon]|nr:hypothetical protein [Thermoplasmata archaeon]
MPGAVPASRCANVFPPSSGVGGTRIEPIDQIEQNARLANLVYLFNPRSPTQCAAPDSVRAQPWTESPAPTTPTAERGSTAFGESNGLPLDYSQSSFLLRR